MQRKNLDSLCDAISAGSEIRTIEQLQAEGKKKIAIVTREKVRNIICTIVDEVVTQEVGHLTEQERAKLHEQTQERLDAMLKQTSNQESNVNKLKDELMDSNKRLESAILETKAKSGADEETKQALSELDKQLRLMSGSLAELESKPTPIDDSVLDQIFEKLRELEEHPATLAEDSLSLLMERIHALADRQASIDESSLNQLLGKLSRLEESSSSLADGSLQRRLESIEASCEQQPRFDPASLDILLEKITALENQPASLAAGALDEVLHKLSQLESQPTVLADGALDQVLGKLGELAERQAEFDASTLDQLLTKLSAMESQPATLASGSLDEILAKLAELTELSETASGQASLDEGSLERLQQQLGSFSLQVQSSFRESLSSEIGSLSAQLTQLAQDTNRAVELGSAAWTAELAAAEQRAQARREAEHKTQEVAQRQHAEELKSSLQAQGQSAGSAQAQTNERLQGLQVEQARLCASIQEQRAQLSSLQAAQGQLKLGLSHEIEAQGNCVGERLQKNHKQLAAIESFQEEFKQSLAARLDAQAASLNAGLSAGQTQIEARLEGLSNNQARSVENLRASLGDVQHNFDGFQARALEDQKRFEAVLRANASEQLACLESFGERTGSAQAQGLEQLGAQLSADQRQMERAFKQQFGELQREFSGIRESMQDSETALLGKLASLLEGHQAGAQQQLQEQFEASMNKALKDITRVMEAATAKPINPHLEGADALLDRMLDGHTSQMTSNMGSVEVEEHSSSMNLALNLGRLRQVKGAAAPPKPKTD